MKSDREDNADVLLVMLAKINDAMMAIRANLASNPAVAAATRGCDIRRYRGSMREDEDHRLETYVEATTHMGEIFCWSLDIILTSLGWEFQRNVARQTSDGEQQEKEFEDFTFRTFDELAKNYIALMMDFEESAKTFEFRI
jgi:hypothetical protein